MIREGALDATLEYIAENPRKIAISSFSDGESGDAEMLETPMVDSDIPTSASAGTQHPKIFRLSHRPSQGIRGDQDRLRAEWARPIKTINGREGPVERDGMRTKAD